MTPADHGRRIKRLPPTPTLKRYVHHTMFSPEDFCREFVWAAYACVGSIHAGELVAQGLQCLEEIVAKEAGDVAK